MKDEAIKKINNLGKIGNVIVNIAKVMVGIVIICTVAAAVFMVWAPKDLLTVEIFGGANIDIDISSVGDSFDDEDIAEISEYLEDDYLDVNFNNVEYTFIDSSIDENVMSLNCEAETTSISIKRLLAPVIIALLYAVMSMVTLFFVGTLCKAFGDCNTPFESGIIIKIKRLAYSLIPWAFVSFIADSAMKYIVSGKWDIILGINLDVLFAVLIILALAYVFQYGAVLQQESDETL